MNVHAPGAATPVAVPHVRKRPREYGVRVASRCGGLDGPRPAGRWGGGAPYAGGPMAARRDNPGGCRMLPVQGTRQPVPRPSPPARCHTGWGRAGGLVAERGRSGHRLVPAGGQKTALEPILQGDATDDYVLELVAGIEPAT